MNSGERPLDVSAQGAIQITPKAGKRSCDTSANEGTNVLSSVSPEGRDAVGVRCLPNSRNLALQKPVLCGKGCTGFVPRREDDLALTDSIGSQRNPQRRGGFGSD